MALQRSWRYLRQKDLDVMDAIRERLLPGRLRRIRKSRSAETEAPPQALAENDESRVSEQAPEESAAAETAAAMGSAAPEDAGPLSSPDSTCGLALIAGTMILVVLGATSGWLGYQTLQAQRVNTEREHYLQAVRQTALNLTTIDYSRAEADVQRIIDGATGEFREGFSERAQPFIDTVKRAQSRSVGTVTQAGLESMKHGQAQAIVAVTVTTTSVAGVEDAPKSWRMRLGMESTSDGVKASRVEFVQ
jgi:Mce-associated membrane protein